MTTAPSSPGSGAMSLAARAAFVLLPLAALVTVLGLLAARALPVSGALDWVPALGVQFAWRIDGLSALMLLMITGVGSAVFVYAGGYFAGDPGQRRLYLLLTAFMLAMIGCVVADDLFVLFLFWEATSLLSFLLVGFKHESADSRRSAQQALMVTGTGGLALLAGFIVLAQVMGTSSIGAIVQLLPQTPVTPALTSAVLLILLGAFTKSAQFPFHFWLPNAMTAPTPVSAYLHSATMVKLGVYLLARLDPGLDDWPLWQWLLQGAGSITAAWGMVLALRERDMKRILAWSTVATLGTLVALVGLPGSGAAVAVGALLLAHSLYKAPLFFVAGNIDHGTGTREIDRLGNLRHAMPWTAAAALLAGMSMAGIPLSFGYVVKDLIGDAKSTADAITLARMANTVFSAIAVAVAGVAAVRVFWGDPGEDRTVPEAHEGGWALVAPPLVLASLGILLGLAPFYVQSLVQGAADATTAAQVEAPPVLTNLAQVATTELLSFVVTFAFGAAVFFLWDPLHRVVDAIVSRVAGFGLAAVYERSLGQIPRAAAACTRAVQHGRSPAYLALAAGFASAVLGLSLWAGAARLTLPAWQPAGLAPWGASLLIAIGAVVAMRAVDRLVLLLGAGLVGYGSAILFLFAGAPDVALTQFVVETVFVLVAAALLIELNRRGRSAGLAEPLRWGALVLAAAFASLLTWLLLAAIGAVMDPALADWFAEQSVPAAHGRNVVNVILVDFRALDTLGEITVVLLSLLAAVALLGQIVPRGAQSKAERR